MGRTCISETDTQIPRSHAFRLAIQIHGLLAMSMHATRAGADADIRAHHKQHEQGSRVLVLQTSIDQQQKRPVIDKPPGSTTSDRPPKA